MSLLVTIAVGIVLLGGLVFFHELGHFAAAKAFGVKVLKFSLGFGPRLWGFRRGETEYQIAALPLGGYVKMAGEQPGAPVAPEDRGRGFLEQKAWKRAVIALAGPVVNLLLPPLVYAALFLVPQRAAPPVIGFVMPGEPADAAGLKPGDRVLSVDGVATRSFDEMKELIESRPGTKLHLRVEREGAPLETDVTTSVETEDAIVEKVRKGKIGIVAGRLPPYVAVVEGGRAHQAGVRTFDRVASVNGRRVGNRVELEQALRAPGPLEVELVRSVPLGVAVAPAGTATTLRTTIPAGDVPLGVESPDLYVREVKPDSQAWRAGLRPGDKIVALGGTQAASGLRVEMRLRELRREDPPRAVMLSVEREGVRRDLAFVPSMVERMDALQGPVREPEWGFAFDDRIYAMEPYAPSELVSVSYGPVEAVQRGVRESVNVTRVMALGIAGLFTAKVSARSIGGPVLLFQLAGASAEKGLADFLKMFALISINLGLLNLLPVPVLDGFHVLVSAVEGVSRRPVSLRVREVANYIGLAMLLALMVLALFNDLVRTLTTM